MELVYENFSLFNGQGLIGIFLHYYQNRRLKHTDQNGSNNIGREKKERVSPRHTYTDRTEHSCVIPCIS